MSGIKITVSGTDLGSLVKDVTAKKFLDFHADVVLNTPVDSGRLRAGNTVDTETLTFENNVEYAWTVLEGGHSKQAPAGTLSSLRDKHFSS